MKQIKRKLTLSIFLLSVIAVKVFAANPMFPKECLQNKGQEQRWSQKLAELHSLYQSDKARFKEELSSFVRANNNLGGELFHFSTGDKFIYRSSILSGNLPCLKALIQERHVNSVIYLYSGKYINEETIPFKEEELLHKLGGHAYIRVLNFNDSYTGTKEKQELNYEIINIVKLIANAKGNVLIHCIGGWHRTGIIYGVLQKCINKEPLSKVITTYKKYTHWKSEIQPGVYKQVNVNIINDFNCATIK